MSTPQTKLVMTNQFGEESINTVAPAALTAFATALPANATVAAIAALATPLSAITIALSTSGGNTYTDAAVNTAVNTALASAVADMQLLVTKVNALLAGLKLND